jgi:hypothetical protein
MKLENSLETVALSIQMRCQNALGHIRNGNYLQARAEFDAIQHAACFADREITDWEDQQLGLVNDPTIPW